MLLSFSVRLRLQRHEAEGFYRQAVAGAEARLGKVHPDTLSYVNNLAGLLMKQGQLDQAEVSGAQVDSLNVKLLGAFW